MNADELKRRTWEQRKFRQGKETVTVQHRNAEPARELAKTLGCTIRRGFGTGEGNIDELLGLLAFAYQRDPDTVLATLREWQRSGPGADVPD